MRKPKTGLSSTPLTRRQPCSTQRWPCRLSRLWSHTSRSSTGLELLTLAILLEIARPAAAYQTNPGYLSVVGPPAISFQNLRSTPAGSTHLRPVSSEGTNSAPAPVIEAVTATNSPAALPPDRPPASSPETTVAPAGHPGPTQAPSPKAAELVPGDSHGNETPLVPLQVFMQFFQSPQPGGTNRQVIAVVPVVFDPPQPPSAPSSSASYTSH